MGLRESDSFGSVIQGDGCWLGVVVLVALVALVALIALGLRKIHVAVCSISIGTVCEGTIVSAIIIHAKGLVLALAEARVIASLPGFILELLELFKERYRLIFILVGLEHRQRRFYQPPIAIADAESLPSNGMLRLDEMVTFAMRIRAGDIFFTLTYVTAIDYPLMGVHEHLKQAIVRRFISFLIDLVPDTRRFSFFEADMELPTSTREESSRWVS